MSLHFLPATSPGRNFLSKKCPVRLFFFTNNNNNFRDAENWIGRKLWDGRTEWLATWAVEPKEARRSRRYRAHTRAYIASSIDFEWLPSTFYHHREYLLSFHPFSFSPVPSSSSCIPPCNAILGHARSSMLSECDPFSTAKMLPPSLNSAKQRRNYLRLLNIPNEGYEEKK